MKRRNILIGTGGLLASMVPLAGRAAPCPPPTINLDGGASRNTSCAATTAQADWNSRVGAPGVVWYHNFDTAAEVNAFRWFGGTGNEPTAASGPLSAACAWVATGGADGGGYMQITRPTGTAETADWWRPLSPLTAASNGRGVVDPGANGSITPQVFNSANVNQTWDWQGTAKPGYYGHSSYASDSHFDGTDFYVQVRVMADPRRTVQAVGSYPNQLTGKFVWITTTSESQCDQELVTLQCYVDTNAYTPGSPNYHNGYQGHNFAQWGDVATTTNGTRLQLGSQIPGVCDPYNHVNSGCWSYALNGTWDTLLYHITPGTDGGGTLTRLEVWAAHQGETSYTKIWDILYPAYFSQGVTSAGAPRRNGWNALKLSAYNNGFLGYSQPQFWTRYDQVIFSKNSIACPQV